jgi:hypothetical protein
MTASSVDVTSLADRAELWLECGRVLSARSARRLLYATTMMAIGVLVALVCGLSGIRRLQEFGSAVVIGLVLVSTLFIWPLPPSLYRDRRILSRISAAVGNALYCQLYMHWMRAGVYADAQSRDNNLLSICERIQARADVSTWTRRLQIKGSANSKVVEVLSAQEPKLEEYVNFRVGSRIDLTTEDSHWLSLSVSMITRSLYWVSIVGAMLLLMSFLNSDEWHILVSLLGSGFRGNGLGYLPLLAALCCTAVAYLALETDMRHEEYLARRLAERRLLLAELERIAAAPSMSDEAQRQFVERCEAIIAAATGAWAEQA